MKIKTGDTVRFLNATGGGVVTRIDDKKGLVYVEDEDGFEIPTLERDCVVVPQVTENNFPKKDSKSSQTTTAVNQSATPIVVGAINQSPKSPEPIIETPDGDTLKVLLAFFPVEIKQLQTTPYDCYLVNDSNYFLYYNVIIGEKGCEQSVANGLIEPNIQEELTSVTKEQLNDWENLRIQIIAFKQNKNYIPQNNLDISLKLNAVKFYKLHSFSENDYFDEPCMLIDLTTTEQTNKLSSVTADEIKQSMFQKQEPVKHNLIKKIERKENQVIEIDLHIHELVDSTAGMSNADMLLLQIDKFKSVVEEYKNRKGQKIVFIHGKGEGVLRKELEKLLKTQYKNLYFQDASFREYGFGATMITIR